MNTFLKAIITVFILVAISFAFTSASHAMSINQHLITGSDPKGYSGCAAPPTKTAFSPTDARVYSWLFISNAFLTDVVTWKWYAPDNSLYVSYPYTPGVMGSACTWGYMNISGQPAASKTGTWKVEIYSGSTLAATDTFTIGNPLCTYTYSAWGPCQTDGTQERTITSSSPAGCIEWLPQLTQSCTYVPPALSAPKNLRYTFSNNILTINWDSVAGAAGYKLGLGTQAGKYDNVNNLGNIVQIGPADVRTATPGTYTFYLAVKAYAGSQESAYSNEIFLHITVAGPSIEAPKNLRFSMQGNMMTIIWDAVSGASGYKAGIGVQSGSYLGPYDFGKATQIGPFDSAGVPSGTYYLAVKAYQNGIESAYSNEIILPLMPPIYTLSVDQKNLIVKSGNPQYLSIVFNSDPERREETWTYTDLGKMYLFWDGVQVGEQNITIDPTLYAKPPSVDPSLFAKNSKPYDVIKTFGNDYTVSDASSLDPGLTALDFKTYYFKDKGVLASFIGETLAVVQTNDIPGKSAAGIGQMDQKLNALENSDAFLRLEKKSTLTSTQLLAVALFIGMKSTGKYLDEAVEISNGINDCINATEKTSCIDFIRLVNIIISGENTLEEMITKGFFIMLDSAELISLAETNCNSKPSALNSNKLSSAVINCPKPIYSGPFLIVGTVKKWMISHDTKYTCSCTLTQSGTATVTMESTVRADNKRYSGLVEIPSGTTGTLSACSTTPSVSPEGQTINACPDYLVSSWSYNAWSGWIPEGTTPDKVNWTTSFRGGLGLCAPLNTFSGTVNATSIKGTVNMISDPQDTYCSAESNASSFVLQLKQ